eukprot:6217408-Amphidinium_carterae.1
MGGRKCRGSGSRDQWIKLQFLLPWSNALVEEIAHLILRRVSAPAAAPPPVVAARPGELRPP